MDLDLASAHHFALRNLPMTVGRGLDVNIRVLDRWVSRLHCELVHVDGKLIVRDLESRYGTLVNRQHVSEHVLQPGDLLTIGMTTLFVVRDGDDRAANGQWYLASRAAM